MKYTGKIAIPDLTKGMEMIPQAYIARNKAYAAGRKQQADALKAANDARSKTLAQLGGITSIHWIICHSDEQVLDVLWPDILVIGSAL